MTRVQERSDGTSGVDVRPRFEAHDRVLVIATGEVATFVRYIEPIGHVELQPDGDGPTFLAQPREVRHADEPPVEQVPTPKQIAARELADGLAAAGAFAAANPTLSGLDGKHRLYVGLGYRGGDTRARVEEWVAAARAAGARITEVVDKDSGGVDVWFGPVSWHVYAPIEELGGEKPQTKRVRRKAHRPLLGDDTTPTRTRRTERALGVLERSADRIAAMGGDATEVPDCICTDSNLPAHKDCPHCYPGGAL